MSENVKAQTSESESFMQWEDWLVLLTGGILSSGAIGWCMYSGFKYRQFDYKAITTIAASFAGGVGIYFTGSALVYMCRKSTTSKKDALDPTLDFENSLCERFSNVVNELDRKFACEASKAWKCKDLDARTFINNNQEEAEELHKSEPMTEKLNYFNRKGPGNGLKLPSNKKMETCSDKGVENRKAKFREEILSYINELKGYVQGAIDPLPLARNVQFRSTEMSDEMRRQVVMIVREYANSMLPKLQQVIDEFVDLVYDKEHKVKKAIETLGVSENDLSIELLTNEMKQYYNALENATRTKPRMPSCKNGQRSEDALGANMQPLESAPSPPLHEKNFWTKTSERSFPMTPKLATPTSADISSMSKEVNNPGRPAVGKLKTPAVKLALNQEQMDFLNFLKSEL